MLKIGLFMVISSSLFACMIALMRYYDGYQCIYTLGPASHHQKKIPQFGGIVILCLITIGMYLFNGWADPLSRWLWLVCIGFGGIGLIDDGLSLWFRRNKGLSAWQKLGLQVLVTMGLLWWYAMTIKGISGMNWLVYGFIFVGSSNAANLTDGLDGLLAGISIMIMACLWLFFGTSFWLMIMLIFGVFLLFNYYPARILMGDSGALAVGGLFGAIAVMTTSVWPTIILGGVFIIETVSVILQVAIYKCWQKRLFLMAPVHHHFELLGIKEPWVVVLFWLVQGCCCGLFYSVYLT